MTLRGERALITGGTGFVGRQVAAQLEVEGATVTAVGSRDFDLRQRAEISRMLDEHKPTVVVHLAAIVGGIGANRAEPGRFFYENAVMGIELIEACRVAGVTKTVLSGNVNVYPENASLPFIEDDIWAGYPAQTNAPYALASKMLLVQAQAYRAQYGMNIVYLVPTNVYGPGDRIDLDTAAVVPAVIRRFLEATSAGAGEVVLWGDGSATRDLLFVDDAARAFGLAVERYDGAEPMNVASGEEVTIRDLAKLVKRIVGFQGEVRWDTSKPTGQLRRRLNTGKAKRHLDFEPRVSLEEGIEKTVDWLRAELGIK